MMSFSISLFRAARFAGLLLMLLSTQALSADRIIVSVTIQGASYSASLQENSALLGKLGEHAPSIVARHYQGVLLNVADSWVRVSNIDGQWQGVASYNGGIQIIEGAAGAQNNKSVDAARASLLAAPVSNFSEQMKRCGVGDAAEKISAQFTINADVPADTIVYSSFCDNIVNGVCLIAELELIFDQDFQDIFGSQASAQAASLVNIAEGYYMNDMNMAFDVITIEMLSSNVFTTSTDAAVVVGDMRTKKASIGQLSFLQNNNALTHLVTGRDFDGATAGIAYVNSVCDTDYSVGTSSVVGAGPSRIPLTALVVAHELGHNFGAYHDGGNGCPSGVNVMSPSLVQNASSFSSCSITEMQSQIDTATNSIVASSCFNFPADAGIAADGGNPTSVNYQEAFATLYAVSLANGYQAAAQLLLQGTIAEAGGEFTSVTADGNDCALTDGSHSYACTVNSPGASIALNVQGVANGTANQLQLTNTVSVVDANVVDLSAGNNQLSETISITGGVSPPSPPPSNTTVPSSNGGKSGGMDWWLLACLGFLFCARGYCYRYNVKS